MKKIFCAASLLLAALVAAGYTINSSSTVQFFTGANTSPTIQGNTNGSVTLGATGNTNESTVNGPLTVTGVAKLSGGSPAAGKFLQATDSAGTTQWAQLAPTTARAELSTNHSCPTPETVFDGLTVSITTTGNPVLLTAMVNTDPTATATIGVSASVYVDGSAVTEMYHIDDVTGDNDLLLTISTVVPVTAGTHTIDVRGHCDGPNQLTARSFSATELH